MEIGTMSRFIGIADRVGLNPKYLQLDSKSPLVSRYNHKAVGNWGYSYGVGFGFSIRGLDAQSLGQMD